MPRSAIEVKTKPSFAEVKRRVTKARSNLSETQQAHSRIAVFLDRWVQQNFRTEGRNVGGWDPFAAGGRRLRSGDLDTSAKLLQDTGRLRASFVPFSSRRDAGIGSDLPYSKPHEEGLGHLPMRRMLPKLEEVHEEVTEIYDNFVKISLRPVGQ